MSTEKKHSALPFTLGENGDKCAKNHAICAGAQTIAKVYGRGYPAGEGWSLESEADARFIVQACNSHEELVHTLEIVLKSFEAVYNHRADMLKDSAFILPKAFDAWEDVQAAQQVLKKARGEA